MNPEHAVFAFELTVSPRGETAYALTLYQQRPKGKSGQEAEPAKIIQVWGAPLGAVMDQVLTALRNNGYKPSDLRASRTAPFRLGEADGVRLGLLFLAVKPLRKLARMERISERIRGMELEELYYWYSKCTAAQDGLRARKAFRILNAEE